MTLTPSPPSSAARSEPACRIRAGSRAALRPPSPDWPRTRPGSAAGCRPGSSSGACCPSAADGSPPVSRTDRPRPSAARRARRATAGCCARSSHAPDERSPGSEGDKVGRGNILERYVRVERCDVVLWLSKTRKKQAISRNTLSVHNLQFISITISISASSKIPISVSSKTHVHVNSHQNESAHETALNFYQN